MPLIAAFLFGALLVSCPRVARATCSYSPVTPPALHTVADPTVVWGIFNSLATCAAAQTTASGIIPTSTAQATFGGGYQYVFPQGLSSVGPLAVSGTAAFTNTLSSTNAVSVRGSYVEPMYTTSGGAVASTAHAVFESGTCSSSPATAGPFTGYTATVALSSSAVFASVSTSATSFTIGGGAALAANNYWLHDFGSFAVEWNSTSAVYVQCAGASLPFSFLAEGT